MYSGRIQHTNAVEALLETSSTSAEEAEAKDLLIGQIMSFLFK